MIDPANRSYPLPCVVVSRAVTAQTVLHHMHLEHGCPYRYTLPSALSLPLGESIEKTPCTQRICHLSLSLCTLTLATLAACGGPRRDKTAPFALSLSHLATPVCTSRAHVKKAPGPLMCECWVCYLVSCRIINNTDLMEIGAGTGRTPGQRGGINRFQRDRSEIDRRRCVSAQC